MTKNSNFVLKKMDIYSKKQKENKLTFKKPNTKYQILKIPVSTTTRVLFPITIKEQYRRSRKGNKMLTFLRRQLPMNKIS